MLAAVGIERAVLIPADVEADQRVLRHGRRQRGEDAGLVLVVEVVRGDVRRPDLEPVRELCRHSARLARGGLRGEGAVGLRQFFLFKIIAQPVAVELVAEVEPAERAAVSAQARLELELAGRLAAAHVQAQVVIEIELVRPRVHRADRDGEVLRCRGVAGELRGEEGRVVLPGVQAQTRRAQAQDGDEAQCAEYDKTALHGAPPLFELIIQTPGRPGPRNRLRRRAGRALRRRAERFASRQSRKTAPGHRIPPARGR